jgi:arylsulfatase A-like enzyme
MNRRQFLRLSSTAGAGLAALHPFQRTFAQPEPYNLLFIEFDDMNDWVGYLGGHPNTLTPNMDAFAQTAVQFTNAHSCAPACNPSRTAMFTGLLPSTTGIYDNNSHWEDVLGDDYPSMPDRFQQSGYENTLAGKFYHSYVDEPAWDRRLYNHTYHNLRGLDPFLPIHPHNGTSKAFAGLPGADFFWGPTDEANTLMQDSRRTEYVVNTINDGLPEPFFIAFGTNVPHYPNTIPRKYLERFNPAQLELPPYLEGDINDIPPMGQSFLRSFLHDEAVEHKQWRKGIQGYLAAINFADEMVGNILNALENSGYADNTIVIITSDHGHHLGEKRHWRKWTLWEESLRVPMLIRVPGVSQPGSVCEHAVSQVDLYPTLIDLCGLEAVPGLDGVSLVPQLIDPATPTTQPAISSHSPGNHTVRSDRWRYIQYSDNTEELYDHQSDPNEWYNCASNPEYAAIKDSLASWIPEDPPIVRRIN